MLVQLPKINMFLENNVIIVETVGTADYYGFCFGNSTTIHKYL